MSTNTIDQAEIDAIVGGYHGAPRKVLGLHAISPGGESTAGEMDGGRTHSVIRAFRPLDKEVLIRDLATDERHPMEKIDPEGLFEVVIDQKPDSFYYRLIVCDTKGNEFEIDDPYRFDPWISGSEARLYSEGNFV